MQFMVECTITPEARNEVQALFKATGAMPPSGVELLGRWHDAASLNACDGDNRISTLTNICPKRY